MHKAFHPKLIPVFLLLAAPAVLQADRTLVEIDTNFGDIIIELYADEAPGTVENFLTYVTDDFFDGLIFHRVVNSPNPFVIQAGAYDPNLYEPNPENDPNFFDDPGWIRDPNFFHEPRDPIDSESDNGFSNVRGTIAMALSGGDKDSGTSQFFINLSDNNTFLDAQNFTVFGKVVEGMEDVVDVIAGVATQSVGEEGPFPIDNVPEEDNPVIIQDVNVIREFDDKSGEVSKVRFIQVEADTERTYVGQGGFVGHSYTQTYTLEKFLGVNSVRIVQSAVASHGIESFTIILTRDTLLKNWVLFYSVDGQTSIEPDSVLDATPLSELGDEDMYFRLIDDGVNANTLEDPNNTIMIIDGDDVEIQKVVGFDEMLDIFPDPELNEDLALVRTTSGPNEPLADWNYYHEQLGLALSLPMQSSDKESININADGWRFLKPRAISEIEITLKAGNNRSKSQDTFALTGSFDMTVENLQGSTLFVVMGPYTASIDADLFKQAAGKNVFTFKGTLDEAGTVHMKIDFDAEPAATFEFSARNIDLTGLDTPIKVEINTGAYFGAGNAVMAAGKIFPMILRRGVSNRIRVDRFKFVSDDRPNSFVNQSLKVWGGISSEVFPLNLVGKEITIKWGIQIKVIPADPANWKKRSGKEIFTYRRPDPKNPKVPISRARFDLEKGRFWIFMNSTNLTRPNPTQSFTIKFDIDDDTLFSETVGSIGPKPFGNLPSESED